jgi:hypothetical protein
LDLFYLIFLCEVKVLSVSPAVDLYGEKGEADKLSSPLPMKMVSDYEFIAKKGMVFMQSGKRPIF